MKTNRASLRRLLVSVCLALLTTALGRGQITNVSDDQATPIPGVGHDYIHLLNETVNPANGSLSLRIQVPIPKGRGLTLPFSFSYDSSGQFHPATFHPYAVTWASNQSILSQYGWSYSAPLLTLVQQSQNSSQGVCDYYGDYVFQTASGERHSLYLASAPTATRNPACGQVHYPPYSRLTGGDDEYLAVTSAWNNDTFPPPVTVVDPDGTVYKFSAFSQQGTNIFSALPTVEDRNGNIGGGLGAHDSLGRTVISTSSFGNTTTGDQVTVSGLQSPYVVTWTTINYNGYSAGANLVIGTYSTLPLFS